MSKVVYLDFEFNRTVEPKVNLVCCCTEDGDGKRLKWWLHNSPKNQAKLVEYLKQFETVIGYSCVAEARSFLALGLDPLEFGWIDEFLEYRMLTNHNDRLQWGKQLVDGKVRTVRKPKPKWERTQEDVEESYKATHSLAECTFKLTGKIRDTEDKTKTRDLIISDPETFTEEQRRKILAYCMEDVVSLSNIWSCIKKELRHLFDPFDVAEYVGEARYRGRYSALTALMEARGYPINVEATRNFSRAIPYILMECQRDINAQFPEIRPFKWKRKAARFQWNQVATREWLKENHKKDKWMMTDGGKKGIPQLSLALEAWERFYAFKHSYPRGNFGAQMVRFLKLKQSLYGFSESGGKRKNFWDSVGSDGRVRPYMNIFGAQSGRSQPAASGFMFLKPAWMRALVQPPDGWFIAGIDYGQQEFFLAALESQDENMIEAYLSGDPYLYGAKQAGVIPPDGTKATHYKERDLFKNTYLGILYGMTKWGLAIKLTNDTGRKWTEDEAQIQIDIFEKLFPTYIKWKNHIVNDYRKWGGITLPCGWTMFGDNENMRSVVNVPVQGRGASIMRRSVDIAETDRKVQVLKTLHDAIYMQGRVGKEEKIFDLYISMRDGFQYYYRGTKFFETAGKIKLDPFAWSPNYEKDSQITIGYDGLKEIVCPTSNLYIDERAIDEYNKFSKYFSSPDTELL